MPVEFVSDFRPLRASARVWSLRSFQSPFLRQVFTPGGLIFVGVCNFYSFFSSPLARLLKPEASKNQPNVYASFCDDCSNKGLLRICGWWNLLKKIYFDHILFCTRNRCRFLSYYLFTISKPRHDVYELNFEAVSYDVSHFCSNRIRREPLALWEIVSSQPFFICGKVLLRHQIWTKILRLSSSNRQMAYLPWIRLWAFWYFTISYRSLTVMSYFLFYLCQRSNGIFQISSWPVLKLQTG